MANFQDLLNQATATGMVDTKKAALAEAATAKQTALMPKADAYKAAIGGVTDSGIASASPMEEDMRTMTPFDIYMKYGDAAPEMIRQRAQAGVAARQDTSGVRGYDEIASDSVASVGMGLANAVGGIGAAAAGVVNTNAGTKVTELLNQMNEFGQGTQSEPLQGARRALAAKNALDQRDTAKELAESPGGTVDSLRRVGKDFMNAVTNAATDPTTLGDGVAQGVGSLLAAGPLSKAVGVAGKAAVPVAIGAMEGGGAYQQTVTETLAKLKDRTDLTDDKKREMANQAGLMAAAIQAPVGAALGTLVSKFEGAPLSVGSLKQAGGNLVRETIEEGAQSGTGQMAQNKAIQTLIDPNQSLTEGVGEQIGSGALYGLGTAGVLQAPGAALQAVKASGTAGLKAVGALGSVATQRVKDLEAQNEKASPLAPEVVIQAVNETMAAVPEQAAEVQATVDASDATPEQKAEVSDFIAQISELNNFDPANISPNAPAEIQQALQGATSYVDALSKTADVVNQETDPKKQLAAFGYLRAMRDGITGFLEQDIEAIHAEPPESQARKFVVDWLTAVRSTEQMVNVQKAEKAFMALLNKGENLVEPITDENISTPEGQQNAMNAVTVATVAPEKADLPTTVQALAQAEKGNLQLLPAQIASLKLAKSILEAGQMAIDEGKAQGLSDMSDVVSKEITVDTDKAGNDISGSILQHAQRVMKAYRAGNNNLVSAGLLNLREFAQHMMNKVGAINEHLAAGYPNDQRVSYLSRNRETGAWLPSEKKLWINPKSAASVALAKTIGLEAKVVADVFNNLVEAFPNAGVDSIEHVDLDAMLVNGSVRDVMRGFKSGERSVKPKTVAPVAPAPEPAAPKAEASAPVADESLTTEKLPAVSKTPDATQEKSVVQDEAPKNVERPKQDVTQPVGQDAELTAEPVKTQAPAVEKPVVVATETIAKNDDPVVPKEPMDQVFPDLVQTENSPNWLKRSFKVPAKIRSRIMGDASPLETMRSVLANSKNMAQFMGVTEAARLNSNVASAYDTLFVVMDSIKQDMQDRFTAWTEKAYSQSEETPNGELFLNNVRAKDKTGARKFSGKNLNRRPSGRALNTADVVDGKLQYNESLLDAGVLAAAQWMLTAGSNYTLDDEQAAKQAGISTDEVTPEVVAFLSQGSSLIEVADSLGSKIQQYWGLEARDDANSGNTKGIAKQMAVELLKTMVESGLVKRNEMTLELPGQKPKTLVRFVAEQFESNGEPTALREFPTAIEEAIMIDPEQRSYFGDVIPKAPTSQMRNDFVPLTDEQVQLIENANREDYFLNKTGLNLMTALSEEGALALFANGEIDPDLYNDNDLKTLEGQNLNILSAVRDLQNLVAEAGSVAAAQGIDIHDLPIHYGHDISRVGRLQQKGASSPQASKYVREVVLPTRATLDLSNTESEPYFAFQIGLAQGLGVKVHTLSKEALIKDLQKKIVAFPETLKALDVWMENGEKDLDAAFALTARRENGNKKMTPVALHALTEWARLLRADDAGRKAFQTHMYVEADGVTNGPGNAMVLLGYGPMDGEQVANMAKVGLFFDGTKTMNQLRSEVDNVDLYKTSTNNQTQFMQALRDKIKGTPVEGQMTAVLDLMDLFVDDLDFDAKTGELTVGRGVAKNPLTITLYGSGASGIAGNLTKEIAGEIYSKMSAALKARADSPRMTLGQAMFGGTTDESAAKFTRFTRSLNALKSNTVAYSAKNDQFYLKPTENGSRAVGDLKEFKFTNGEFAAISKNIEKLFVDPLRSAIDKTVGESVMQSAELLRKGVQVQSIFLKYYHQRAMTEMLTKKKAADPDYTITDGLTATEEKQLMAQLKQLNPIVNTGTQSFYFAGSQSVDVIAPESKDGKPVKADVATSMGGDYGVPMMVSGPENAGVAGIPGMVIGTGDGKMMQVAGTMVDGPKKTVLIFDGAHMALDRIAHDGTKFNEAVSQTWKGNPVKAVADTYNSFLKDASFDKAPDGLFAELGEALLGFGSNADRSTQEVLQGEMEALGAQLTRAATLVDVRHEAMQQFGHNIDQMASVSAPFEAKGKSLEGKSPDEIAAAINDVQRAKVKALNQSNKESVAVGKALESLGRKHKSGARVLGMSAIEKLAKMTKMSAVQAALFDQIRLGNAAQGYSVVYGSAEQIAQYQSQTGKTQYSADMLQGGNVKGYTSFGEKVIYMVNPSTETLIHELIHASSFEKLVAHYRGDTNEVMSGTVGAIEALMAQFMNLDQQVEITGDEMRRAYASARAAITNYSNNPGMEPADAKAAALNEFMAWGLANEALTRLQERNEAHPVARLVQRLVDLIKALVWGRKTAPKLPGNDMLSNLQWHTTVVIRSQPTVTDLVSNTALAQSVAYGSDDRLTKVNAAFETRVKKWVGDSISVSDRLDREGQLAVAMTTAVDAAIITQTAFPMSMQESSTYRMIVGALATEASIDPNTMARSQEVYDHVVENLKVENFMVNPADDVERYYAQQKFDSIVGSIGGNLDVLGRSTLLSNFIGLATVNDEFRAVLNKMDMPAQLKREGNSLDEILESYGNMAMDKLTERLSGIGKPANVQAAMDNLNSHIVSVAQERELFLDTVATKTGSMLDRANDIVVQGMTALSDAGVELGARVDADPTAGKIKKFAAQSASVTASMLSEKNGAILANGVMEAINRVNGWKPFTDFITDLVGRTVSNAKIFDMIKAVRSNVQQDRQKYRETVPTVIAEKFKSKLSDQQWTLLNTAMSKTDLASIDGSVADVVSLLGDAKLVDANIGIMEGSVKAAYGNDAKLVLQKSKQLANFMMTGEPGANLLRNATAVGRLFGMPVSRSFKQPSADTVKVVDQLTTLYALQSMSQAQRDDLSSLVQSEAAGLAFTHNYMRGQRKVEMDNAVGTAAEVNHYKGYAPVENQQGVSLIVADDSQYSTLAMQSFKRVGTYDGSGLESKKVHRGYYFAPVSGRAAFNQGIVQNVRSTAGGVDLATGYTYGTMTAGRITDLKEVGILSRYINSDSGSPFLPVYDNDGKIVALERSVDVQRVQATLKPNTHLAKIIGMWRGRQVEEGKAAIFNRKLVDSLHTMYENDIKEDVSRSDQYVNILSAAAQKKDPVLKDAVRLMPKTVKAQAENLFGSDAFLVRRDMLADAFGYRSASVGDAWTGNSRWSKETQSVVRTAVVNAFGNDAYRYAVNAEKLLQNYVSDARVLIVVKSVVVPMTNLAANVLQMTARGIPLKNIVMGLPKKTAEVDAYVKSNIEKIRLEAELAAVGSDVVAERKIKTRLQTISDMHKRMSIWPLIEAGEFTAISDAGISRDEILLSEGKLHAYMETLAKRLPGPLKTAGRYALVTKDTALFQGMQKAMEYGDFLAKAILFDDLTTRKKMTKEEALGRVSEEYVNYDRLPGRFRGYLESIGMLWFYNFKIRSAKVALSMIRNNPVHSLMASMMPTPDFLGSVGLPIQDNIFSKAADGALGHSMGLGQGLAAPTLNPWYNLVN